MTYGHRWFLVRHGQTEWNRVGRAQGQSDPPLNQEGQEQAEAVAVRLAPVSFEVAYSSDLRRAADTAVPVMRGRDTPIVYRRDLREKSFGEWEGMTYEQVRRRYPAMLEELFSERPAFAPPGGESDLDLFARAAGAAAGIAERHAETDGNILVVSHGGTLRAMMVSMLGLPIESMWRLRLSNAGLSVITVFAEGGATIDLLNDTSHLGPGFDD
ncbi:MAG: histidine phosphatase family protein [Acidimicrobiia bacterium]|nr:histidine phosphatase family protein [Acidimicrobiia bacterium]